MPVSIVTMITVPTKTKVRIERKIISAETSIEMHLKASGGQAIWITAAK